MNDGKSIVFLTSLAEGRTLKNRENGMLVKMVSGVVLFKYELMSAFRPLHSTINNLLEIDWTIVD